MEKSFTQEAMETLKSKSEQRVLKKIFLMILKEFGVDSDAPDLFSSETENSTSEDLLSSNAKMKRMILKYQHS